MAKILVRGAPIKYSMCPEKYQQPLQDYIETRKSPGPFLTMVLCNDLIGALDQACSYDLTQLYGVVLWLENYAPKKCFGSPEVYETWMKKSGW